MCVRSATSLLPQHDIQISRQIRLSNNGKRDVVEHFHISFFFIIIIIISLLYIFEQPHLCNGCKYKISFS